VIVTDEAGNFYEPTYPKRAQGLIKNERARAIGENEICLIQKPGDNDADAGAALPLPERKGRTMNENSTDKTPGDSREYLDEIMAQLLKSISEPIVIDPHLPNVDYQYQRVYQQRDKILDKIIMLHAQMREAENTASERPDFEYIRAKLDNFKIDFQSEEMRFVAQQDYAKLLSQFMALQESAKRQAMQDRIINHAWIDQKQKIQAINAINTEPVKPGKGTPPRVSMDTSQGYNFDDMPGMPNFVKQLINKGYMNPMNNPMMMGYVEEWRRGENSYPGPENYNAKEKKQTGPDSMNFSFTLDDLMENIDDITVIPDFVKKMLKKKQKNMAYWQKRQEDDDDDDDEDDDEDDE